VWTGLDVVNLENVDPVATEGDLSVRVVRGGSWVSPARGLRSADRFGAGGRDGDLGFRCAGSAPSKTAPSDHLGVPSKP
jgi:formylglycine-generating enzyme required for sulfatase activity